MFKFDFNNKSEIVDWLNSTGEKQKELFKFAQKCREKLCDNKVYVRGVLEISNYCECNCMFCGNAIKSQNHNRYRIDSNNIFACIDHALSQGITVIHFAAGQDKRLNKNTLIKAIKYATEKDVIVELALGFIDIQDCKDYFDAGAQRFILKFETSNEDLFKEYKKCKVSLNDYKERIKELKKIGYKVGSGNIIGLPGQTVSSLVDDLLLLSELDVDMASSSVFTPNIDSEMSNCAKGDINIGLNYMALLRILFRDKNISIPSNSTFGVDGKSTLLKITSNELSYNITPKIYKGKYSLYSGQNRKLSDLYEITKIISDCDLELCGIKDVLCE